MALFTREEALEYHRSPRHGKTEVVLTKRCESQKDLSLAYSPGVAEACKPSRRIGCWCPNTPGAPIWWP